MINAKTQLNMVVGFPLEHTQSPLLHAKIYKACNINAVLLAFPHKNIESLIDAIKTLSIGLTAITMPYKEKILYYSHPDHWSVEVKALQAANTLVQRESIFYLYNTDIDGIAYALREVTLTGKQILILGAGGSARAVAYYLNKHKAIIYWYNRSHDKAEKLAAVFGGEVLLVEDIKNKPIDMIINTTPIGMMPEMDDSPLPNYVFKSHQIVFDLIYNPLQTALLRQAKNSGAQTISGIEMFIGQAIRQVELWTAQKLELKPNLIQQLRSELL